MTDNLNAIEVERNEIRNRELMQTALDNELNKVLDVYTNEDQRKIANDNLMKLILRKTEGKLKDDIKDYDLNNLTKAVDFIKYIGRFDNSLLIEPGQLDEFVKSKDFTDFVWDIRETNQGQ